jgi:predicted glycosyltransferase
MRILIFLSHPAQFLFFKNAIYVLISKGHSVLILIKRKDVLPDLLDESGLEYHNILPKERGKSRVSIVWSLLIRDIKIIYYAKRNRIELFMGSDASLSHAGKLLGIPCITTLEDDYKVVRNLARLTYPYTSHILVPEVCNVGKWDKKKIGYPGYMKLAYLHPRWFKPNRIKAGVNTFTPFFLIRLSSLSAHHDFEMKGIKPQLLDKIIEKLTESGRVFISSEKTLPTEYQVYCLNIPYSDIHHCLSYTSLFLSDSQSMTMEAAMLGVPSIRISSFVNRISVLEELEHCYGLTFGFQPESEEEIFKKINELIHIPELQKTFQYRRRKMLAEKIDVTSFLVWLIENFPLSVETLKKNPAYVKRFI